jgi:hypothetical protein
VFEFLLVLDNFFQVVCVGVSRNINHEWGRVSLYKTLKIAPGVFILVPAMTLALRGSKVLFNVG